MTIGKNQYIGLTVSPKPKLDISLKKHYNEVSSTLSKILRQSCSAYILYPELSPINGHLHFHGVIKISDPIKYCRQTLRQLAAVGNNKQELKLSSDWYDYIQKDWDFMKNVLDITEPVQFNVNYILE